MAIGDIKFSELPTGSAIQNTDIVPWVQSGVNVKQPATAVATYSFSVKTTTDLTEGSNLYFTDARARSALSGVYGIDYDSSSGEIGLNAMTQGQLVIGVTGGDPAVGDLISSDGSIQINTSNDGEIDLTAGSGLQESLQDAYEIGSSIQLDVGDPMQVIFNSTAGTTDNAVTTLSTQGSLLTEYTNAGWKFYPTVDMNVIAMQYPDSVFNAGGQRQIGIFDETTQQLLVSGYVSQADPLVGIYRTRTLATPFLLLANHVYVCACVAFPNETLGNNGDATTPAEIVSTAHTSGPVSFNNFPVTYPSGIFLVGGDYIPTGYFQFETVPGQEEVTFNTPTDSPACIKVVSSNQGTILAPVMDNADMNAIASPEEGLNVWNSDYGRPYGYDGSLWRQYQLSNASYLTGTTNPIDVDWKYIANDAGTTCEMQMPTTAKLGAEIKVIGRAAGGWKLTTQSGQTMYLGSTTITNGQSVGSTDAHDCLSIVCTADNTEWTAYAIQGNLTTS